jgi:formyl-CoA transferase
MAAYIQAQRTGLGQVVEVSMQEAVINFTRTNLSQRERDATRPIMRRGNRTVSPTDLYPCAPGGPNDYVYFHIATSLMLDALCTAIDMPELTTDERFSTPQGRRANGDALHEAISSWTRQRTKYEVMEYLGPRGVPVGATLDSMDIFRDKHLKAREAIVTVDHPERGPWEFPAPPVRLSNSSVQVTPAPLLGQHTSEVLSRELGLRASEVSKLESDGVVGIRDLSQVGAPAG